MAATRVTRRIAAARPDVFDALLDARAVAQWRVPQGMTSRVHEFEPYEGGAIRVSLTYDASDASDAQGKTAERTDTYHGHFARLVPNELVVEVLEFETADPALAGRMTVTTSLRDADAATDVTIEHVGLPPGVDESDNETGTAMSLSRLAALLEARRG